MSSINSIAKSMNGIKTIETSEVIFTDDNSSLISSTGITNALNNKIKSVDFNTANGVLTLTKEDNTTLTKDLDGRYVESLSTCVLKTTAQTIAGVKTFNEFPIKTGTTLTELTPTADGQLTPKKYLDHKLGDIDTIIDEIRENVYDDAEITSVNNVNTLTLKRPDGGSVGNTALTLPQTSLSTCVLKTTDQTIDDVKTFTSFPVKSGTTTPTTDGQLATKKYVDDNAGTGDAVLNGANVFTSTNAFNTHRPSSSIVPIPINPTEPQNRAGDADFIMKKDGDLLYLPITNNGVAYLNGHNDFGSGQGLGSNSFNPRPTTTLTNTITSGMFITKNDAENQLDSITTSGNIENTRVKLTANGFWGVIKVKSGHSNQSRLYFESDDASKPLSVRADDFIGFTNTSFGDTQVGNYIRPYGHNYLIFASNPPTGGGDGKHYWRFGWYSNPHSQVNFVNLSGDNRCIIRAQNYSNISDDRTKLNETPIENAMDTLKKLNPVTYDYYGNLDCSGEGEFSAGLVAQEIWYNCPELRFIISTASDVSLNHADISNDDWGTKAAGVNYTAIQPYMIKAIQDHQTTIEKLNKSNQELHERILKLEEKN